MSAPSDFNKRLAKLVGENVEILLENEKTIEGKLLSVGKEQMNVAISSTEWVFFIPERNIIALKKEVNK